MTNTPIEQHPDMVEMQARYERIASTHRSGFLVGCTLLAGLYLAISPWVIPFGGGSVPRLNLNDVVTGLALVVLCFLLASAYSRVHNLAWMVPVIGVWTLVAPWVILRGSFSTGSMISNVVTGGVTILLGLAIFGLGEFQLTRRRSRRNN